MSNNFNRLESIPNEEIVKNSYFHFYCGGMIGPDRLSYLELTSFLKDYGIYEDFENVDFLSILAGIPFPMNGVEWRFAIID